MSACVGPLSFERLVHYWAGDTTDAETDAIDEHLFSCAVCTEAAARVGAITERLRALGPPFISHEKVAVLRARGFVVEENFVAPGARITVTFDTQDYLIHHLGGLDLTGAERVAVVVRVESTGEILAEHPSVPFDRSGGEILVACQRHFAAFPPDISFEVETVARGVSAGPRARYAVLHRFAQRPGA